MVYKNPMCVTIVGSRVFRFFGSRFLYILSIGHGPAFQSYYDGANFQHLYLYKNKNILIVKYAIIIYLNSFKHSYFFFQMYFVNT